MYRDLLIAPFKERIRVGNPVIRVWRENGLAFVKTSDGVAQVYDKVIFACHADEALNLIADPTPLEQALLSKFTYQENRVTLHTDAAVMPRAARTWSSWNYRIEENGAPSTIYWMNSLQRVSQKKNYFVSVNDAGAVRDELILKDFISTHPLFDTAAIRAQNELPLLNNNGTTYFCGSYFRYGFHEDAYTSSIDLCRNLLRHRSVGVEREMVS